MPILHIDMDCFFAAIEERENPELKGKPVVVGANPKADKPRGVVSTCNYEARKFGIHSAMPISKAYRLCHDAVYLTPNFKLYIATSKRLMKIFKSYSKITQQVSIDELYLDIKENYTEAKRIAQKIQKEVKTKENLTCSIGIGPNKLIAKIASDFKKPNGITIVPPEKVIEFLSPLSVRKLMGIGPKTEERLLKINIKTIMQLQTTPIELLMERFGKWGTYMHAMAHGIGSTAVGNFRERKSIGKQRTFHQDTKDPREILELLTRLAEEIHEILINKKLLFKTVTVVIRFEDFETHTTASSTPFATDRLDIILKTMTKLINPYFHDKRKIRLAGVRVSNLKEKQRMLDV